MTQMTPQQWEKTIEYNRRALFGILIALFNLFDFDTVTIPARLKSRILRDLRPAESAARRLIHALVKRMSSIKVGESAASKKPVKHLRHSALRRLRIARAQRDAAREIVDATPRAPLFALFDRPKRYNEIAGSHKNFAGHAPSIWFAGGDGQHLTAAPAPVEADALQTATHIAKRIIALKAALQDLPYQAKRMAKAIARRHIHQKRLGQATLLTPCRPGFPPGYRKCKTYRVDVLLSDCEWLQREAVPI